MTPRSITLELLAQAVPDAETLAALWGLLRAIQWYSTRYS